MARLPQPSLCAPDHTEPCHAFLPSSSAFADQARAFPSLLHHPIARRTAPHLAQLSPIRIYNTHLAVPALCSTDQSRPSPSTPHFSPIFYQHTAYLCHPIRTRTSLASPRFSPHLSTEPALTRTRHSSAHQSQPGHAFLPSFTHTAPCRTEPSLFQSIPAQAYHEQTTLHLLHHTNH